MENTPHCFAQKSVVLYQNDISQFLHELLLPPRIDINHMGAAYENSIDKVQIFREQMV
jgi:hypothetical protein